MLTRQRGVLRHRWGICDAMSRLAGVRAPKAQHAYRPALPRIHLLR